MALVQNKKIHFNYEIQEKLEAGIQLHGFEVKALKQKKGSLEGTYVVFRNGEAFVQYIEIPPYQPANTPEWYEINRPRKLLLSRKELVSLQEADQEKGLTVVPVSVYNKGRHIKLEVAVVRGKKQYDKRETIKQRDVERDLGRSLKNRHR